MKKAQQTRENGKSAQESINEELLKDFADEIDLSDEMVNFPDWVYDYREQSLTKQGRNFLQLCHVLKDGGVNFKVKYPLQIDGKWKFADILIPQSHIVILLIQNHETIGLPCHSKTDRELWFGDRFRTLSETQRIAKKPNLTENDSKPLVPKTDIKPETSVILENFGFMIIAGFFGMWHNVPLDLEHFEEDKPYYEEYFKVESEFNKRIILPE